MPANPGDITVLLNRLANGDESAAEDLIPRVYDELRALAARHLRRERIGHTLEPTALVHEAYLRLMGSGQMTWANRAHFFGVAANTMRRVLIDYARKRHAQKRGDGMAHIELEEHLVVSDEKCEALLAVDQALDRLAVQDARQARVVELRYFVGLTEEETALVMGISSRTVRREWLFAKAWLAAAVA